MSRTLKALLRGPMSWLLLVVLLNAATSVVGLLMIAQTGISSLLRPMPAVVFVSVLCLGWRGAIAAVIGVMGSYLICVQLDWPIPYQSSVSVGGATLVVASVVIQSLLQVEMLRRIEELASRIHPLTGILLVAPAAGLLAPSVLTLVMSVNHTMPPMPAFHFWLVVYCGNLLGTLAIYPLAWVLDREARADGARRRQPMLVLSASLVLLGTWLGTFAVQINMLELERSSINERFSDASDVLDNEAENIDLMSIALQQAFRADQSDPPGFDELAEEMLAGDRSIAGLALAQSLSPEQQAGFEAQASTQLGQAVQVRRIAGNGEPLAGALERSEIVIGRVAPSALAARMTGLAISSDPQGQQWLADSALHARARLSPALDILRDEQGRRMLAWAIPLRHHDGAQPAYLMILHRPQDLVDMVISESSELPSGSWVELFDITGSQRTRLYSGDEQGSEILTDNAPLPSNLEVRSRQQIMIGGRFLELLVALPSTLALAFTPSWWTVQILVQLFGAGLAAVLVIAIDRRDALRDMREQLSVLSRRYLNFERTQPAIASSRSNAIPLKNWDAVFLRALESGEFLQCYEPVVSLSGGHIIGFESLLRWPSAPFSVPIPDIISWAERTHHIHQLTLAALTQAIELVEGWKPALTGRGTPWISINVSPEDLGDTAFINQLMDIFRRHPQAHRRIKLEITEGVLVGDFKSIAHRLRWLRDQGLGIALDDFGTGYSSLSYLHQLPVDSLKIDRSFVAELDADPRVRDIVQATVGLGRRLKLEVIAEGVEETATLAFLESIGCHAVQGWLFAGAQPAAIANQWVRDGRRFDVGMATHLTRPG